MSVDHLKSQFLSCVETPVGASELALLANRCQSAGRKASPSDRIEIAAALAHTAFLAPDKTAENYDALTQGWLGRNIQSPSIACFDGPAEPVPSGLWKTYWNIVEDGLAGKLDALTITQRTAALGHYSTAQSIARIAKSSYQYKGVAEAGAREMPELIKLETLEACAPESLGRLFHDLIVENKFDLEVLDRTEIGLSALPAPLEYLNTRMLQAHDLWHITAGYETTALHEIAISSFQMAQFGHNYSAQFLSIVGVIGALSPARSYGILMDTITDAWIHGRETQAMILIPWEEVWNQPVEKIRADYAIKPFKARHRADIIEHGQALQQKIERFTSLIRKLLWRNGKSIA